MKQRRGVLALLVIVMFAASSSAIVGQSKDEKKKTEAQNKEIQNIVTMVDNVAAGQPAPNDFDLKWVRVDFLKAQGNKEYAPFTISIDPSKVPGGRVAMYWRVVATGTDAAAAAAPAAGKKDDKKDKKKPDYAYEDISFIPATSSGTSSTPANAPAAAAALPPQSSLSTTTSLGSHISRSFTVPAGSYDVYVVVKEPLLEKAPKNAPAPKVSMLKQTVTVPEYWNSELATSSVIVAQRIDPLPAPLTPQQQADRPYALGSMEIMPTFETKFTKKAELSTFMLIYNPKVDNASKPDVSVEYNFYQKLAGQPEKFFNKTNPQNLNAQTLPPQFDLAAGHQLQSGQAVPLASFPEGDYRLEIKVTDKIANKTLTREINFTVSPS
jgi:hypothetical protein